MASSDQRLEVTKLQIDDLINLFVMPGFDPFDKGSLDMPFGFAAEGEVVQEEGDTSSQEHQHLGKLHIGRKLAHLGDEYYVSRLQNEQGESSNTPPFKLVSEKVREIFLTCEKYGEHIPPEEEENLWKSYKGIMDQNIRGTIAENAFQAFGAFLLALTGVQNLSLGAKRRAVYFAHRYAIDTAIPQQLVQNGGLDALD